MAKKPTIKETARKLERMKFDTSTYIRLTPMSELIARVEAAKEYDRRRKIAQKALRGIDTYAWSMVPLPAPARKELQKRIDACRSALNEI